MKKVLFWISFIISLMVLNEVPSFAMEFSVSPEMIGGLGDIGYGLLGGASFDFSGTEYVIDGYDNLSEQLKAEAADRKAREFIQAYSISRGLPIPNVGVDPIPVDEEGFYKSLYFNSSVRSAWNQYKLGQTIEEQEAALRFPIGPQAFADWTSYNEFWYNNYIDQFYTDDVIDVQPDPNYLIYIDNINGSGFWFKDNPNYNTANSSIPALTIYPPSQCTWFLLSWVGQNFGTTSNHWLYMSASNIKDVYINGTYDNCSCDIIFNPSDYLNIFYGSNINQIYNNGYADYLYGFAYNNNINRTSEYHFSGSLPSVLSNISNKVKNINIYFNNVLWSAAGAPANPLIPTFPDVIGGTDDDPYPAYDIVFPNTSDYEGSFDLTSLFDAIKGAIAGASDNDDTTSGTLTRDKVSDTFKDKVGEAVGETTKTMDTVLEDSFPIQGTLNYPALPPIPELPIGNAFMGTTILAQLIDACQQILPEPLVLVFWGIIFILFIIGLIKILHK